MERSSSEIDDLALLRASKDGQRQGFNEILLKYRERLKKMVALRMNMQLRSRIDASDVIQDTFTEAARVVDEYLANPKLSVFLWLRRLAGEKLIQAHRFHLQAQKRDARREQSFGGVPTAPSQSIAVQLAGEFTSPSEAALKQETNDELMDALDSMEELDREVLVLKHFEHLSNHEIAEVLELKYETVKKRYLRALSKLQQILVPSLPTNE